RELPAQHVGPVTTPLALLTGHGHIFEEVHLELLEPVALTLLAASAGHVERKRASRQAERLRPRQRGEDLADLVEGLHVSDGVRARRATDRLLIDEAGTLPIFACGQYSG